MRIFKATFFTAALLCGAIGACTQTADDEDESMYLTGTEEQAVMGPNGTMTCTNPKKVLICHIPPGNPGNAHDICVGKSAVEPHQQRHGDTLGTCAPQPPPPDAGTTPDTGGGGGDVDGGIVLQ
jgi:hypothetical protein